MNRVIDIGIFSTLFLSSIVLSTTPFEFYISYIPMVMLLPLFMMRYKFPLKLFYLFIPLLIMGLVSVYAEENTFGEFFKIYLNIIVSSLFFYYVCHYYEFDITRMFDLYMKGAYLVSIIGLVQLASYFVGLKLGYDFKWLGFNKWSVIPGGLGIRVNSVFSEPSYFGASIGPAFFIAVYNILFRKTYFVSFRQSVLIAITYLLTFSTVAYLGVFVVLVLLLVNFGLVRYLLFAIPAGMLVFTLIYNNAEEFKIRIDGIKALYIDNILEKEGLKEGEVNIAKQQRLLRTIHGSSFVQYNNYIVAVKNFSKNPFFGTGLGSHKTAFEKYNVLDKIGKDIYNFNNSDANSMFLRLMSETGLFGLIFIFLFIKRFFIKIPEIPDDNDLTWLVSNAALVIIFLQLARQGNYTYNGFFFYMWLYYFTYQKFEETHTPMAEESKNSDLSSGLPVQPPV